MVKPCQTMVEMDQTWGWFHVALVAALRRDPGNVCHCLQLQVSEIGRTSAVDLKSLTVIVRWILPE